MTSLAELTGPWRIVSMELWDIDLVEPAFIDRDGTGRFGFIAVNGVDGLP